MSPEELSGSENTHAKRTPIIDAFLNASDPAAVIAEVDAVTIEDPDLLMEVVMAAPQYFNVLFTVLRRVVENFEMLPANLTTGALTAVGEDLDLRELGMALTSTFKLLNKIHQEDPGFIIRMLEKPINDLLDNVDAGELKELVDGWADDPGAFMTMLNDALWKNPAKLVSIFAAVPGIVNALIAFISELLRPMLDVAPELLAEIILQIVAGVRGKDLGQITNRLDEVDMPVIVPRVPKEVVIAGNIPTVKVLAQGTVEDVRRAVADLCEGMRDIPTFLCMPGCEVPTEATLENLRAMIDESQKYAKKQG